MMYSDDGKDFLVQASSHLECNFIRSMQEKCTFNVMDEGVVDVTLWCDTKWRRNECKRSNMERSALFQHFEFALSVALAQRVVRIYLWIWYHYVLSKTSLSSLRCFQFFFHVPLQFHWTHFMHEWTYKSEWKSNDTRALITSYCALSWCMQRFPISFDWK